MIAVCMLYFLVGVSVAVLAYITHTQKCIFKCSVHPYVFVESKCYVKKEKEWRQRKIAADGGFSCQAAT